MTELPLKVVHLFFIPLLLVCQARSHLLQFITQGIVASFNRFLNL